VPLDHWLGEKLLVGLGSAGDFLEEDAMTIRHLERGPRHEIRVLHRLLQHRRAPVSHAEPYLEAGEAHRTSS
jgi:hypothetical protein